MQNKAVLMILSVFVLFTSCYKEVYYPPYVYEDTRIFAIYYNNLPLNLEPSGTYPDPFLIPSLVLPNPLLFRIIPTDPYARVSSIYHDKQTIWGPDFFYFYIYSASGLSSTKYIMRWWPIIGSKTLALENLEESKQ